MNKDQHIMLYIAWACICAFYVWFVWKIILLEGHL